MRKTITTLSLLVALTACAGRGGGSSNPGDCMSRCEADCPGKAGGPGDNEKYVECLSVCEKKCS